MSPFQKKVLFDHLEAHILLVFSVKMIIRSVMLELYFALTTQLRLSQLRSPKASSLHVHTRTELLQVIRAILQADLQWKEVIIIVF